MPNPSLQSSFNSQSFACAPSGATMTTRRRMQLAVVVASSNDTQFGRYRYSLLLIRSDNRCYNDRRPHCDGLRVVHVSAATSFGRSFWCERTPQSTPLTGRLSGLLGRTMTMLALRVYRRESTEAGLSTMAGKRLLPSILECWASQSWSTGTLRAFG